MKAVVHTQYGSPDGLRIDEVETPVPHGEQVLVGEPILIVKTP